MKIGIDARLAGLKNRGLGRYLDNLLINLEIIDKKNQYCIFLDKSNFDNYQFKNSNFNKIKTSFRWYSVSEQIKMPLLIKKHKIDLMHFPHFNVPLLTKKNFIITLHDLTLIHFPDRRASTLPVFIYKIKYYFYKKLQKNIIKKAKKIVTPSNFVKNDLINYYKLDTQIIKVIYEGCKSENTNFEKQILEKFKISKPYILYVGSAYPHKNLERLIKAYEKINKNNEYQLVIVSKFDYFINRLRNWVNKNSKNKNEIIFTDFLNDHELNSLFQKATVFALPSLSEGFGLPGLEAQINNLAITSSNQTCLKEILGKGALYFDPFDIDDIANKIHTLLINKSIRERLIKFGHENVKKYSWEKMAEETLSVYNNFDLNK